MGSMKFVHHFCWPMGTSSLYAGILYGLVLVVVVEGQPTTGEHADDDFNLVRDRILRLEEELAKVKATLHGKSHSLSLQ